MPYVVLGTLALLIPVYPQIALFSVKILIQSFWMIPPVLRSFIIFESLLTLLVDLFLSPSMLIPTGAVAIAWKSFGSEMFLFGERFKFSKERCLWFSRELFYLLRIHDADYFYIKDWVWLEGDLQKYGWLGR